MIISKLQESPLRISAAKTIQGIRLQPPGEQDFKPKRCLMEAPPGETYKNSRRRTT